MKPRVIKTSKHLFFADAELRAQREQEEKKEEEETTAGDNGNGSAADNAQPTTEEWSIRNKEYFL